MCLRLCRLASVPRGSAAAVPRVVTASRRVGHQTRPRTMAARPAPGDLDPPTRPRPHREWTTGVHPATAATEGGRKGPLLTIDATPATFATLVMLVTADLLASSVDAETGTIGTGATSGTVTASASSNDETTPGATSARPIRHRHTTLSRRNGSS